jgi:hypothetical protein
MIRTKISPLDMHCYLRARFGKPNGISSILLTRKNTSDNYIHWDFQLKCGNEDVYILGYSKQFQIILSQNISDDHWRHLIRAVKSDFGRVAREKSVLGCLEPNMIEYVRAILEDPYPGYDIGRKITGHLFPENKITGSAPGMRYDDEL